MARNAPSNIPTIPPGRRIQTRRSGVHGKGVFALEDIAEGEVLIEYIGEVIGWQEAHPNLARLYEKLMQRASFSDTEPRE